MQVKASKKKINRRQFLIKTGWAAGGITLLSSCQSILPAFPSTSAPEADDTIFWLQILPTGRVQFLCPRMEMGQGASIGLTQIVAEELNLNQQDIDCLIPNTGQLPPFKVTVGSESISLFHKPVAIAAARLREHLRGKAALKLNLETNQTIDVHAGFKSSSGTIVSYKDLITGNGSIIFHEDETGAPEPDLYFDQHSKNSIAIGKNWRHHDLNNIVTGKMPYSRDISLPNMTYGLVFRPPYFGAVLSDIKWNNSENTKGILLNFVDKDNNFAGLIAENPFVLNEAKDKVEITWIPTSENSESKAKLLELEPRLKNNDFEHEILNEGIQPITSKLAEISVSNTYSTPYYTHAAMEPRSAVASVSEDQVEIWCGSQDPYFVRSRIARLLGKDDGNIIVHPQRMGGAFGGRVYCRAAEEAALLSNQIKRPVRVQWDRNSEFKNGYFQPMFTHQINAGVSKSGEIQFWNHDFVSSPIITGQVPGNIAWAVDIFVADKGTARGAISPYAPRNQRIRYSDIRTNVSIGAWRGLGSAPNCFAIESTIDELTTVSGFDPIEFRLKNLPATQKRMKTVLKKLKNITNWAKLKPVEDEGFGIACAIYKEDTYVAIAAHVHIDHTTQEIQVRNIWCVQDCGRIINPDLVKNQILGNVVWGTSMTLKERVTFENDQCEQTNFDGYGILRHSECPNVHIELIETSGVSPSPAGEAALAPVPAAITNAVFAATGQRGRNLPLDYEAIFNKS